MIKKFVSNALLSVVMDKDARKKLNTMRKGEEDAKPKRKAAKSKAAKAEPRSDSGEDVVDTIAQALAEARAEVAKGQDAPPRAAAPAPSEPRPRPPAKPTRTRKAPASTPERERLIQEALSIQRQKSHVLDELDTATREKLMFMAMYAMDPSSLPPEVRKMAKAQSKAEGLVDDLGTKAGSLRKKPGKPRK